MGSIILTGISQGRHQFSLSYPEVYSEVLEAWLSRQSGCVEITVEGVDLNQLRKETLEQEIGSNKRAAELVDAFLRRVATAPLLPV